jgi:hypothetical protein
MRLLDAKGNWTQVDGEPNANWTSLTINRSGSRLLAASGSQSNNGTKGALYMAEPTAGGALVWTDITRGAADNGNWVSVDMDASGQTPAAAQRGGAIFIADTRQANWKWQAAPVTGDWTSVWISDDGQTLAATADWRQRRRLGFSQRRPLVVPRWQRAGLRPGLALGAGRCLERAGCCSNT